GGLWYNDSVPNTFSYINNSYGTHWDIGDSKDNLYSANHEKARVIDELKGLDYYANKPLLISGNTIASDVFDRLDSSTDMGNRLLRIMAYGVDFNINKMRHIEGGFKEITENNLQWVDVTCEQGFNYPLANDMTTNVSWDRFKNTDTSIDKKWIKGGEVKALSELPYEYSLDNLVIANPTTIDYKHDEDAVIIPPPNDDYIQHENYKVLKIVNVVNIVTLPDRTPIKWTDLTISRDIESFAWSISVNIANQESIDAIKPSGLNIKEIEVDINGELFNFFIAKTNTTITNKAKT
ncbi:MAG: hypothetical protein ACPH5N_06785, partial [Pseudomonadales bacterium]